MIFWKLLKQIHRARIVKGCEAIALRSQKEICTLLLRIIFVFKQSWQKKKNWR